MSSGSFFIHQNKYCSFDVCLFYGVGLGGGSIRLTISNISQLYHLHNSHLLLWLSYNISATLFPGLLQVSFVIVGNLQGISSWTFYSILGDGLFSLHCAYHGISFISLFLFFVISPSSERKDRTHPYYFNLCLTFK